MPAGTVIRSFGAPGVSPAGLTWDGRTIWHSDATANQVYQLSVVPGASYADRVLATGPVAYWPQWEAVGTISFDISGNSPVGERDGAYAGVTLGQPGIGDGRTAPLFAGVDANNVFSANLADVFDGGEGTAHIWCRVSGAGVWTDGTIRYAALFGADLVNNFLGIRRVAANNTLNWLYIAGGVVESINLGALATVDWFPAALTWSASAGGTGEVRAYINGLQTGATQVGLGVWVGALAANRAAIGSVNGVAPLNVWDGFLAHPIIYDRALSPAEVLSLGVL